ALAVGDAGGEYLYEVAPAAAKERLLRRLAAAWRRAGALDAGAAWFAARGRSDVWTAELALPVAERPR
ncbi:MAG: hypothetical protein ACK4YP_14215, partial [Myxococcota bacterium]